MDMKKTIVAVKYHL